MPARQRNRLSSAAYAALFADSAKPGRHSDGGGLYLVVGPGASRRWVFLYRWQGRTREMGLGAASDPTKRNDAIGLSDARDLAASASRQVKLGQDPIAQRKAIRARPTFSELAEEFLQAHEQGWSNEKHRKQWRRTLMVDAAALGPMRVDSITLGDVERVLSPIWRTKHETATRLRARIERVLDMAITRGHLDGLNPARWKGGLQNTLGQVSRKAERHFQALPYVEAPKFFSDLRKREGVSARALEFLTLTAARSGEVRGASWDEIDMDGAVWVIPGERMKASRPHRVPLSDEALDILKAVKPLSEAIESHLVFPGQRGRPLSDSSLSAVLRRMGVPNTRATVHGFRSTFRDWAFEETEHSREIIEMSLAHVVGDKTERAYRRGDALDRRRLLMEHWASTLSGAQNRKVVSLQSLRGGA